MLSLDTQYACLNNMESEEKYGKVYHALFKRCSDIEEVISIDKAHIETAFTNAPFYVLFVFVVQ